MLERWYLCIIADFLSVWPLVSWFLGPGVARTSIKSVQMQSWPPKIIRACGEQVAQGDWNELGIGSVREFKSSTRGHWLSPRLRIRFRFRFLLLLPLPFRLRRRPPVTWPSKMIKWRYLAAGWIYLTCEPHFHQFVSICVHLFLGPLLFCIICAVYFDVLWWVIVKRQAFHSEKSTLMEAKRPRRNGGTHWYG